MTDPMQEGGRDRMTFSPLAANPLPPTPREVDRDSRTAAAGTGLRRQPSFTEVA